MKQPTGKIDEAHSPRFGRIGRVAFVTACVALVSFGIIAGLQLSGGVTNNSAWAGVLTKLGYLGLGFVIALVGGMIWRAQSTRREHFLQKKFGGTVLTSVRSRDLSAAIRKLQNGGVIHNLVSVPLGLSIVANDRGIQVWAGRSASPVKLLEIGWASIVSVAPSRTLELGRTSRGLSFVARGLDGDIVIPFIVTGAGLGKLFPLSGSRISTVVDSLNTTRRDVTVPLKQPFPSMATVAVGDPIAPCPCDVELGLASAAHTVWDRSS